MNEKESSIIEWIKGHKTELIIAGVSMVAVAATIIIVRRKSSIVQIVNGIEPSINECAYNNKGLIKAVASKAPHPVCEHLRQLHQGWNASPEKILTAASHGYDLKPGQTWVVEHRTGIKAA